MDGMQWSALTSIAEVGIGLNLAFGAVTQFREHLRGLVDRRSEAVVTLIEAELHTALAAIGAEGDLSASEGMLEVTGLQRRFVNTTLSVTWFIAVAAVAAIALFVLLVVVAWPGSERCSIWILVLAVVGAAGPVGGWAAWLGIKYVWFTRSVRSIERRHKAMLASLKEVEKIIVKPTPPNQGSSGAPPPEPPKPMS